MIAKPFNKTFKYIVITGFCAATFFTSLKIKDPNWRIGAAGLLAQTTADVICHPIDLINIRIKFNYLKKSTTFEVIKNVFQSSGLKGFFKGGSCTLMGSSLGGFLYFSIYKNIKEKIKRLLEHDKEFYFVAYTIASIIGEFIVYLFYFPFELVKTRMQCGQYNYKHILDGIYQLIDKNDLRSIKNLYSGFLPSLTLVISSTFLTFFTFELARDWFAKRRNIKSDDVKGRDYFICTLISGVISATSLNFLEVYSIQRIINGKQLSFREFMKPKHLYAIRSGIVIRNLYGIFYTIVLLELVNIYGSLYDVVL